MKLFQNLKDIPPSLRGGAVSIGNFDGVHCGHARIIENLVAAAEQVGGPATVLTFDPHPVRLLRPGAAPPPLTWTKRKAELLSRLGTDAIIAYPTDEALLNLTPNQFFDQILIKLLGAKAIIEGPNFFFGKDRTGNIEVLKTLCNTSRVTLSVVEPLQVGEAFISSSRIRKLIATGNVKTAHTMLSEPYRIRGMITHGAGRGAKIGIPTANIDAVDTLLPAQGVYAGRAFLHDSVWPAAIHIGPNPTFGEDVLKVETHIIGFQGSIYGDPLEVDFLERLRDIHPFASIEELKAQLQRDIHKVGELVKQQ